MALQFRNLGGNPYTGLMSTASRTFADVGNAYMGIGQAKFNRNMAEAKYRAQREEEERRREDARYNSMIDTAIKGVGMAMQYDIQQDKIAQDNQLKRLQLEDSSFNIVAKNLKPSALNKFITQRNKYINDIYEGNDVELNKDGFYGVQITKDDLLDPTVLSAKDTASYASAYDKLVKLNQDKGERLKNEYGALYGVANVVGDEVTYRFLTPEQARKQEEETPGSLPRGWYEAELGEGNKLMPKSQIPTLAQFLKDEGFSQLPEFDDWVRLQRFATKKDKVIVSGGFDTSSDTIDSQDGMLLSTGLRREREKVNEQNPDIFEPEKTDSMLAKSRIEAREQRAEDFPEKQRNFFSNLTNLFSSDPNQTVTATDRETTTVAPPLIDSDATTTMDTVQRLNTLNTPEGQVNQPIAMLDPNTLKFVNPMTGGEATQEMVDEQFKNNTAVVTMPEFVENYEKQYGEIPEYVVQARQNQDERSLLARLDEERAFKNFYRDQDRQDQIARERRIDSGNAGFDLSEEEIARLEAQERSDSDRFQTTADIAERNTESLMLKASDGKTIKKYPNGDIEIVNDGSGFVEPVKAPSLIGSEQSVIDAYMDENEYRSKYADYYSSINKSDPRLDQLRILENRIIGHYNDARVANLSKPESEFSKKDARSLAVNKTAEEAYRISYQNSTEEDEMAREMKARAVQNNAKNFAKAIFSYGAGGQSDKDISVFYGIRETADDKLMQYLNDQDDASGDFAGVQPSGTSPIAYDNPFFEGMENPARGLGGITGYIARQGFAPEPEETSKAMAKRMGINRDLKSSKVAKLRFADPIEMEETIQKSASLVEDVNPMAIKLVIETESARGKGKSYDKLGVNKGDQNTKWIDSMDISDEEKEEMKAMYSDSSGVGQMGLKAFEVAKKGLEKEGVYIDWDMYRKGHLQTQVNAVAGYIKYGVRPRLESLYGRMSSNSRNPVLIALAYKGGLVRNKKGQVVKTETAKKLKLESFISKVYQSILGQPSKAKAQD